MFRQFVSARTHRATTCLFACMSVYMYAINQSNQINQIKLLERPPIINVLNKPNIYAVVGGGAELRRPVFQMASIC